MRLAGLLTLLSAAAPAVFGQTAPTVVSVSPADGSTGVDGSTPLVFVFDQEMETSVSPVPSIPPFLVGNIEVEPSSLGLQLAGEWSEDGRTLTITPTQGVAQNTTVSWKLNPPGSLLPFESAAGVALATVSGSYTVGASAGPALTSVTPINNAVDVSPTATVTFRFNVPMKKDTNLGGTPPTVIGAVTWVGTGVDASKFTYTWSGDGRQLVCDYAGDFPLSTLISWALNPAGAAIRLQAESGEALATGTYSGRFTTASEVPCIESPVPENWGSYGLSKISNYVQTSDSDPVPESGEDAAPFLVSASVVSPETGPAVTSASLTTPDNVELDLSLFGTFQLFEVYANQSEMDEAFPAGSYLLSFTQAGPIQRKITMTIPPAVPPIPKVTGFATTQAWSATQDGTLRWNGFTGAAAEDYQSVYIADAEGNVVFQAPDPCVPRELPVSATSIVIPANTLQAGQTYDAQILYSRQFYFSTNAVPEMAGFGSQNRTTRFTLVTTGGTPVVPATLSAAQVLPNGDFQFDVTGTAGRTYAIQRATTLNATVWPEISTVVLDAGGKGRFQDTPSGQAPSFYRAIAR
jgi:hypothetical protein